MATVNKQEIRRAVHAVNNKFPGAGAREFDNGEGWRIALNCGDSVEIANAFMDDNSALPEGTFMEPVNGEVIGLYYI
jgi:hypothetical protein